MSCSGFHKPIYRKENFGPRYVPEFDEIVREEDLDFANSGLKAASVIRVGRLAVVEADVLLGAAGEIATDRLLRIKTRLSQ